jgi:hypothetical protein
VSAIRLAGFSGEQPRITPRLLPATAARSAINARLDNGALTPYRKSTVVTAGVGGPYQTIYKHGGDWLFFSDTVNVVPGPVASDRLYYTGFGKPRMRVGNDLYDLAVPHPSAAPVATPSGVGSGDVQTRIYVYTFVTDFGEESEPSPASAEIDWQDGQTVTLSGIEAAPGGRNITRQRFYRSQSGSVGTDLYFIAERAESGSDFVDNVAPDAFAEPLPSRYYHAPPDDLEGLIALPNGMMAAFRPGDAKQLYFCEPYQPHAWPEPYVLTTEEPIIALAAAGSLVWVLTEGVPYRVTGTEPRGMVMEKVEANLPCINARGVVDLGYAVAWPSNDGLAVGRADGSVGLASANLFAPRDWRRLNPGTMRGGQIEGRWIGSYDATDEEGHPISGSLIVDLSGQASFLIRSGVAGNAWFYEIDSGFAYFLDMDGITVRQFDSTTGDPEQLYWRSKQFVLPHPDTFGSILVETGIISQSDIDAREAEIAAALQANADLLDEPEGIGGELAGAAIAEVAFAGDLLEPVPLSLGSGVTVNVYADEELVATVGTLDRVARLPAGFTARIWEVDVFADIEVTQITMARTTDELKQAAGGP